MRTLMTVATGALYLLGMWTALSSFSTEVPVSPSSRTEAAIEVTLAVIGEPGSDVHCRTASTGTATVDVLLLPSGSARAAEYAALGCNTSVTSAPQDDS